jgi:hypothetical protein
VPLSQLKVRYWFDADGKTPDPTLACYANCSGTTLRIGAAPTSRPGSTHYVELGFTAAAGTLAAGKSLVGAVQSAFHYTDWSNVVRTNDYSFDATKTTLTDWNKVTLYHCPPPSGACNLVWGTEPP